MDDTLDNVEELLNDATKAVAKTAENLSTLIPRGLASFITGTKARAAGVWHISPPSQAGQ